jgi:competence protein ComFC
LNDSSERIDMFNVIISFFRKSLLDLAYPPVCWICDSIMQDPGPVCPRCLDKLVPFQSGSNAFPAGRHNFDRTYILYEFEDSLRRMVHLLKYRQCRGIAALLAAKVSVLYPEIAANTYDCVTAVPLHPVRQRERGYNQSMLLAAHVAAHLQITLAARILQRIRATPSQTKLSRPERRKNVTGAFRADFVSPPGYVLLVDDVITTGSTLDACAAALKESGVLTVDVLALANPLPGHDILSD